MCTARRTDVHVSPSPPACSLQVINKNGYTEKELKEFVGVVHMNVCQVCHTHAPCDTTWRGPTCHHTNVGRRVRAHLRPPSPDPPSPPVPLLQSVKSMFTGAEKLSIDIPSDIQGEIDSFNTLSVDEKLTPELGEVVKKIWEHATFQTVFTRRSEFQLNDSAEFYFNEINRLSASGYTPTLDDVLRSRVRTTGIVQSDFTIKSLNFSMCAIPSIRMCACSPCAPQHLSLTDSVG